MTDPDQPIPDGSDRADRERAGGRDPADHEGRSAARELARRVAEGLGLPLGEDDLSDVDHEVEDEISQDWARELHGDLICRGPGCGYNLRGLSVRSACPECGTPVQATLLAVVDPRARELQPIHRPRWTGVGLVLWSVAALIAALAVWSLRLGDVAGVLSMGRWEPTWALRWMPPIVCGAVLLSGVGALAFVRPHGRIPVGPTWAAAAAVALHVPLAAALWRLHGGLDRTFPIAHFGTGHHEIPIERTLLRLAAAALAAGIALGLRPNARLLVARSKLMRTGRQDRQTLMAMALTAGVGAFGDALHLAAWVAPSGADELLRLCGSLVIGIASLLFTSGLISLVIDSVRLYSVVRAPGLTLDAALGDGPGWGRP